MNNCIARKPKVTKQDQEALNEYKTLSAKIFNIDESSNWNLKRLSRLNGLTCPRRISYKYLQCCNCKEFIGPIIWHLNSNTYICNSCKNTYYSSIMMSLLLERAEHIERQIINYFYPCTSPYECHFTGTFDEAKEHSKNCVPSFTCTYCSCIVDKDNAVEHYLDFHCNKKLFASHDAVFDKISLKLPLTKDKIHVLRAGYNNFILFVRVVNNVKLKLTIVKFISFIGEGFDRVTHDDYVVEWKQTTVNESKKSAKGQTISIQEYFNNKYSKNKSVSIITTRTRPGRLQINIQFNNLLSVVNNATIEECSICMELMLMVTKKCTNGHSVCFKCESKISTCPFCREPLDIDMSLREIFRFNMKVRCVNKNCLKLISTSDLNTHVTEYCALEVLKCEECDKLVPRMRMLEHLQLKHNQFFQTYEFYIHTTDGERVHYILYRHKLFRLRMDVLVSKHPKIVRFAVQLMYERDDIARNFRYEIGFYNTPWGAKPKDTISQFCVPQSFNGYSCIKYLDRKPMPSPERLGNSLGFFRIYLFPV